MLLVYDAEHFAAFRRHVGHSLACAVYGPADDPMNVSLECTDCHTVIVGMDHSSDSAPIIPADVHSDDHVVEASFDAAAWFEHASDAEVVQLADCGWGGDYPADAVAHWMSDRDAKVGLVFAYLDLIAVRGTGIGFECHVDEDAARLWLATHRPAVHARLTEAADPPR